MTQVMAHRGASKVELENTTLAFARALKMGADAVELDVRRCGSGELVVHHDPKLSDGRIIFSVDKRDLPTHIPSLAEALDACGSMWVNIEIKNDPKEPDFDPQEVTTRKVVDFLRERGSLDRWLISSFRRETVDLIRSLMPELKTAWLVMTIDDAQLETVASEMASQGHTALHPWVKQLSQRMVDVFHRHGLQINTWTCDDPRRMRELVEWQVDGICTNVPDLALQVINSPN
ncbi:MAG: glycerophosphodiester phosphodiesterase [Ilumatobacteraceae bacterium]